MENEDGYRLWLRYNLITDKEKLAGYRRDISGIITSGTSPTINAVKEELIQGIEQLLGKNISDHQAEINNGSILAGTVPDSPLIAGLNIKEKLKEAGEEGYLIQRIKQAGKEFFIIAANADIGVLYGTFHFLKLLQTHKSLQNLSLLTSPLIQRRLLNHWDNLDGTIERGYAGFSFWDWHKLPDYISPRCRDYARADASIGINGVVLNNVNANSLSLTSEYLEKTKALADLFRPYHIKVYLSARSNAPMEIGGLKTNDPCDKGIKNWWKNKVSEIYSFIPDFGGFLIKANSEGQPGPQDFNRSHGDGANMFAESLAPYGGIVIWRAFVYDFNIKEDRAKQAYNEFIPLDGKFHDNVLIQVKNGPVDFQPREPFHPLFGAMRSTPLMIEFQITQEYLGLATHLVYLAPLFKECLDSDTHAKGKGSTVARVIDGTVHNNRLTGIAGVANTGSDRNWCGHPFAQANWYAFGRLAWDHRLSAEDIAEEWIRMTFSNDRQFIDPVKSMMMTSRETTVNYMTPLGLHHIMARGHHYGPGPWVEGGRPDWTSPYYHRADTSGIGFNRTATGSNAVSQYFEPVKKLFSDINECPEPLLLWFHHVPWNYKMKSGLTLWQELCQHYYQGVDEVREMIKTWDSLAGMIDEQRFKHVQTYLKIQEKEACLWRDACVLYFQSFSGMPVPEGYEKPQKTLDEVKKIRHFFVPGIYNSFKADTQEL